MIWIVNLRARNYCLARTQGHLAKFQGEDILRETSVFKRQLKKRNKSFPPIKATATGFCTAMELYASFLKKKSTCPKQVFINLFFQRILATSTRTNAWPNVGAPLSTLKRLGRRYFDFEFVTSFHLFSQGLYNRCDKPFFFESSTKCIPRCRKRCFVFLRESIFKWYFPSRS